MRGFLTAVSSEATEPLGSVVQLYFTAPGEIRNLEFEQIAWRTPESLPELNLLAADRELIRKLASAEIRIEAR